MARRILVLLFLLLPNISFAQFNTGPFGPSQSSGGGGSASVTCADGGAMYAHPANTVKCTATEYYYDYTNKVLHVPSVQTGATNTPQNLYQPQVTGDSIFTAGVNGNGNGSNDDHYDISEGSTLGTANRIDIAPGGVVTIPSLTVTTINSSTVTTSIDTLVNRNTVETLAYKTLTNLGTINSEKIPVSVDTLVNLASIQTISNKRITIRDVNVTQSATPTINTDNGNHFHITGLAQAITSVTVTGTPVAGDTLWIDITDNGSARAITLGASFEASTVALPTTTVISTRLDVGFIWNEVTSKWRCIASS